MNDLSLKNHNILSWQKSPKINPSLHSNNWHLKCVLKIIIKIKVKKYAVIKRGGGWSKWTSFLRGGQPKVDKLGQGGKGVKNADFERTSFMDGPL